MPAPAGQTDIMNYLVGSQPFTAEFHLGSDNSKTNPTYGSWDTASGWLYEMKGSGGYPIDGNFVGEDNVYQCITEGPNGWTDPTSYKAFASSSWKNNHGGIAWCPRYFVEGGDPVVLVTSDSTYKTYGGGKLTNTQTLGGPVMTHTYGPITYDCGGDLGLQLCVVQDYFWGGAAGNSNLERRHYAKGYGPVRWELFTLKNGVYTSSNVSLFNRIKTGGSPKVNFPNPLP